MLRIITIAAAATLVSACGSERSGEFTTEDGDTGEYTIDSSTGETTARIETDEGTATLRSGANVPVELSEGFSIYPGAKIVSNIAVNHGEGKMNMVSMETDASPDEVLAHYRKEAEAAGVDISLEMTVDNSKMIGGEGPDGTMFSLNASRKDDGLTQVQLTLGNNQDD